MLLTVNATNRITERVALRTMFAARKQVFVDLLRWDLPVLDGRFEVDQFDDGHAVYLILLDNARRHLASVRLLPTTRPSLLDALFPQLCEADLVRGPAVWEITRLCLSRGLRAPERRRARDELAVALARYALAHGITTYTGVAELGWLKQICTFGWLCEPLGPPQQIGAQTLSALRITIADDTLDRMAAAGIVSMSDTDATFGKAA
jgi:N-acyl-L-homoserine lactone synthetase